MLRCDALLAIDVSFIESHLKDVGCYVLEYTSEEHGSIRAQALGIVSFSKIALHLANRKQTFGSGGPGFSPVDKDLY